MQLVEEESKTLNQDAGTSAQNNSELGPAQDNKQSRKNQQRNVKKTNDGQLVEQKLLDRYCFEQVGLAAVPEQPNHEEENDSWSIQSVRQNFSQKRDRNSEIGSDEGLPDVDDDFMRDRSTATHKMPDSQKMILTDGNTQFNSCPENHPYEGSIEV